MLFLFPNLCHWSLHQRSFWQSSGISNCHLTTVKWYLLLFQVWYCHQVASYWRPESVTSLPESRLSLLRMLWDCVARNSHCLCTRLMHAVSSERERYWEKDLLLCFCITIDPSRAEPPHWQKAPADDFKLKGQKNNKVLTFLFLGIAPGPTCPHSSLCHQTQVQVLLGFSLWVHCQPECAKPVLIMIVYIVDRLPLKFSSTNLLLSCPPVPAHWYPPPS